MAKFNSGEAIHYLNTAETVGQVEHRFKVACDLCCLDPAFMWKADCGKCRVAERHREKLKELRKKMSETM